MKIEPLEEIETTMPAEIPKGVTRGSTRYNEKRSFALLSIREAHAAAVRTKDPTRMIAAKRDFENACTALDMERRALMCEPIGAPVDAAALDVGKLFEGAVNDDAWRDRVRDFAARLSCVLQRWMKTVGDTLTMKGEAQTAAQNRAEGTKRKALEPLVREYAEMKAEHARRFGVAKKGNKVTK